MSRPSEQIRSVNAAEAILDAMNQGVSPSDLAVAINAIQGEKVSRAGYGVGTHQQMLRTARGYFAEVADEIGVTHDAMDFLAHSDQEAAREAERQAKANESSRIIDRMLERHNGGEGVGTPACKTERDALPRPVTKLDRIMGHPLDELDRVCQLDGPLVREGDRLANGFVAAAPPEHDPHCQMQTTLNELATEEIAVDLPLALIGPGRFSFFIKP